MPRISPSVLAVIVGVAMTINPAVHAQDPGVRPARKQVLAWADVRNGYQHDSISHALATIERLGRESGAYRRCTSKPFAGPSASSTATHRLVPDRGAVETHRVDVDAGLGQQRRRVVARVDAPRLHVDVTKTAPVPSSQENASPGSHALARGRLATRRPK